MATSTCFRWLQPQVLRSQRPFRRQTLLLTLYNFPYRAASTKSKAAKPTKSSKSMSTAAAEATKPARATAVKTKATQTTTSSTSKSKSATVKVGSKKPANADPSSQKSTVTKSTARKTAARSVEDPTLASTETRQSDLTAPTSPDPSSAETSSPPPSVSPPLSEASPVFSPPPISEDAPPPSQEITRSGTGFSPTSLNAFAVSSLSASGHPSKIAPPLQSDKVAPQYRDAARRVTLFIIAAPIALVTTWLLWERLVMGREKKLLESEKPEEVGLFGEAEKAE